MTEFNRAMAEIKRLRPNQRDVLGQIAMNCDRGHHPATLEKLERVGLIVSRHEWLGGGLPVRITRYDMPIAAHMAWCQWCSDHLKAEDEA